ncbi:MAG: hypothetical protein ACREFP_12700 [Acetobacteraceae bacterium]
MSTASSAAIAINAERLLQDLVAVSAIGAYRSGVHRPTFSPDDIRARAWSAERLSELGLAIEIDGIGNVIGRSSAPRALLVGSHIESQPYAGRLDGPLGLLYGLAASRALRATGPEPALDIAAWVDEEGWFGQFLGSRSFCGEVTEPEIDAARHRSAGKSLRCALQAAGYGGRPRAILPPGRYLGYAEAHIEKGDRLDSEGLRIGIVSAIVGMPKFIITAEGVQIIPAQRARRSAGMLGSPSASSAPPSIGSCPLRRGLRASGRPGGCASSPESQASSRAAPRRSSSSVIPIRISLNDFPADCAS